MKCNVLYFLVFLKIETDLIAAEARLSTEKERVVSELEQLARGQQKLSLERDEVEEKLKKIEATKNEIENRTQSLNRIAKVCGQLVMCIANFMLCKHVHDSMFVVSFSFCVLSSCVLTTP